MSSFLHLIRYIHFLSSDISTKRRTCHLTFCVSISTLDSSILRCNFYTLTALAPLAYARVNQKIKHAKPAKQWRARYLLFTLSNLIKIDTRDINTTCFPLLKTNPNFVKSVLCSINSYDNFEKTYVHRITSSTQWRCNGTQISSKTQLFGPEKNFAARAPLATTSKL